MTRIANLLVVILAGAAFPTSTSSIDTRAPDQQPVVQLSDDQADAVEWARDRFAQVGLELPDMVIEFDPTKRACGVAEGRYRYDGEVHRVAICVWPGPSFRADLERRRTLLHEFAHAWETANLDDTERTRMLDDLGVAAWHDPDADWEDRGAERFAEVFVFALLDQPLRQLKVPGECSTMVALFTDVTGHAPLGPGAPSCR
jgi:hypothetical protein